MEWTNLPTDFTDVTWNGLKKYNHIVNGDGTVSFEDVTEYTGLAKSYFGAATANKINAAINMLMTETIGLKPILAISAPTGSVVTLTGEDGVQTLTAEDDAVVFTVDDYGTYSVVATSAGQTSNTEVFNVDTVKIYHGVLSYFTATITATAEAGSTVTCVKGSATQTAVSEGTVVFTVTETGTYTLTATKGENTATATVSVMENGQILSVELSYLKIYGISRPREQSSPAWTRTYDAVGMTATASVGMAAGASDFDNCYPWSEIARENIGSDVMVRIPKFWFNRRLVNDIEYLEIANIPTEGFKLHPAFNHDNEPKDYIYVGAYKTSSNNQSVSGAKPTGNRTFAQFRNDAHAKGTGWELLDISTLSAIQALILVEFATYNVQNTIGGGWVNKSDTATSGSTDAIPNLTGRPAGDNDKVDVVWRGIEALWGNAWEFVEGILMNGSEIWVTNDTTNYTDAHQGYTKLSYSSGTNFTTLHGAFGKRVATDTGENNHVMYPTGDGGSSSTYLCDTLSSNSGLRMVLHGGEYIAGGGAGLMCYSSRDSWGTTTANTMCSRLIYIPQE